MPDESGGGGVPVEHLLLLGAVVLAVGREVGRRTDNSRDRSERLIIEVPH
jgi:hypothetical protein